jgi:hypothetical protein
MHPIPRHILTFRFVITGSFVLQTYTAVHENMHGTVLLCYKKGKAIPVTGRGGTPHFLDNRFIDGGEVVSLTRRPPLPPRRFLVLISVRG